jgi:hypothetical protein
MSTMTRRTGPSASQMGASTSPRGSSASGAAVYANLALRFALELAAYTALGYWGASVGKVFAVRVALAILVPTAAMALSVAFLAPKARRRLEGPSGQALELVVFLGASAAASVSVSLGAGLALGVVATANALVLRALGALR